MLDFPCISLPWVASGVGKKTLQPVRLSAAALIAIAILTFGTFTNPVSSDVLLASTAHAESKLTH